jgi:putative transposase
MFNQAISGKPLPKHLSTDHDPLFRFHRWRANLRVLEIDEIKTVPSVPCSHPFIERLIGTIRREYLDHTWTPPIAKRSFSVQVHGKRLQLMRCSA